jgi:hypothetical protein
LRAFGLLSSRSLALNSVLASVLTTLVPTLWVALIYSEVHAAGAIERGLGRLERAAIVVARDLGEVLESHRAAINTLARAIGTDLSRSQTELGAFHAEHPAFITMLVAGADGRVIAQSRDESAMVGTPEPPLGRSVADRDYFVTTRTSQCQYRRRCIRSQSDARAAGAGPGCGCGALSRQAARPRSSMHRSACVSAHASRQ